MDITMQERERPQWTQESPVVWPKASAKDVHFSYRTVTSIDRTERFSQNQ